MRHTQSKLHYGQVWQTNAPGLTCELNLTCLPPTVLKLNKYFLCFSPVILTPRRSPATSRSSPRHSSLMDDPLALSHDLVSSVSTQNEDSLSSMDTDYTGVEEPKRSTEVGLRPNEAWCWCRVIASQVCRFCGIGLYRRCDPCLQNCSTITYSARRYVCSSCFGFDVTSQVTSSHWSPLITIIRDQCTVYRRYDLWRNA